MANSIQTLIVDTTTLYHYDLMGLLITEADAQGELIKDYLWQGMMPIAQINNSQDTEQILYLYSDHLMTNRLATNATQHIVWRWEGEAFGNTPAQELIGISVNLRFPGQYFDEETNLHYNHFRYYDPTLGRYITSDPIGFVSGFNSYVYADANPIIYYDENGLWSFNASAYAGYGGGVNVSYSNGTLEVTGEIGVGVATGMSFDPNGTPSPHAESEGSGYIARTTIDAGIGLGVEPFGMGISFTGASGNAITTPVGGNYTKMSTTTIDKGFNNKPQFGFNYGVSLNAEFGSYTNWGSPSASDDVVDIFCQQNPFAPNCQCR
ncbi:Rhs-family protein [uncultured Candidatus Thioglobus sp.]|nr:Rhs-family protein [uncultured Candidatus Thioglobus sp.]